MVTSPTVEQVEAHVNTPPVAEPTVRGVQWKFTIDGNLVMIAGLLALALAAFSYLNSRVDRLDTKIDGVASELRSEIKQLSADMNARFAAIDARFARVDDKFDKLDAKMDRLSDQLTQIIINQNRGQ